MFAASQIGRAVSPVPLITVYKHVYHLKNGVQTILTGIFLRHPCSPSVLSTTLSDGLNRDARRIVLFVLINEFHGFHN